MTSFAILNRELIAASRRKRYYWARAGYLVILFFFILMMWATSNWGGPVGRSFGRQMFAAFAMTQFILILLLVPAVCVDLLASERRRGTLDLLLVSSQSTGRIVWNKFLSRFLFAELLILSSLAAASFLTAFGGITLDQVVRIVLVLSFTALEWCALAILFSTLFRFPSRPSNGALWRFCSPLCSARHTTPPRSAISSCCWPWLRGPSGAE
jgi:ABC-type transport system involved in multi-copper enzyme maturation permease subunit